MLNYFFKRLLGLLPTLLIVAVLVFLFVHMLPGDPARLAAGQDADEATVQLVRQELGLERLNRVAADVGDKGKVESMPRLEGRQMVMMIGPR